MVYCGKPSGACHACRERRTRCDKLPDGCTQCANARRVCPGYRALGDVLFKNVTTNVIRKAKAGEVRAKQAASRSASHTPRTTTEDGDADEDQEGMEVVAQTSPPEIFSLIPTIDERATGFFVANYVVGADGIQRGHLDYVADIFRQGNVDEGLLAGMKAVGLAGFAHTSRSPALIKNARHQYVKAIQHTNRALQTTTGAKKDATLLTIIILGIFESIIGGTQSSLRDWVAHVNGAADVIKVRGQAGIETMQGRRMLLQVTSNLLISCIQRAEPVPPHISELLYSTIESIRSIDPARRPTFGEPGFVVLESMMRFAQLRSDVVHLRETNPHVIMARCLELDTILEAVAANPQPAWRVQTVVTNVQSDYVYRGRYHVYADNIVSQSWNGLRIIRFMVNEIIRDLMTKGAPPHTPRLEGAQFADQLQRSIAVMYAVQDEILYSIPQHLGAVPEEPGHPDTARALNDDSLARSVWIDFRAGVDERPLARISGALFLIWPMWFVGVNDTASEEIRRFVVRNLRLVGDKMGIQQAYLLAMSVEQQIDIEVSA